MYQIMQDIFTIKAFLAMLKSVSYDFLQGRLVAAWSDSTWDDFMDKHSVVSYIVESTIMDVFDDIQEYGINPWYHPVASFKQVMGPLARFFWECFGKSPVFWLILLVWTIRWAYSNYIFDYTYLIEAISARSSWWRNINLVFWNRDAPAPAENAPPADNTAPADNTPVADNAPPADNSPPADNAALADDAPPAENPLKDENAPALAENAPSADNALAPNGSAHATTTENTPLAENTLIPNGDAPAANEKA